MFKGIKRLWKDIKYGDGTDSHDASHKKDEGKKMLLDEDAKVKPIEKWDPRDLQKEVIKRINAKIRLDGEYELMSCLNGDPMIPTRDRTSGLYLGGFPIACVLNKKTSEVRLFSIADLIPGTCM